MKKQGREMEKAAEKRPLCYDAPQFRRASPPNPRQTQKKRAPPETHFMRFSAASVKIHCVNLRGIFAAIACIYWG